MSEAVHEDGQDFLELSHIVLDSGHDASDLVFVEERHGEALDVVEQFYSEGTEDVLAGERHEAHVEVACEELRGGDCDEGSDDPVQAGEVARSNVVIDYGGYDQGKRHDGGGICHGSDEGDDDDGCIWAEVGEESHDDAVVVDLACLVLVEPRFVHAAHGAAVAAASAAVIPAATHSA